MTSAYSLRPVWAALAICLTLLGACGRSAAPATDADPNANPLIPVDPDQGVFSSGPPEDPAVRIDSIDSLTVERTITGAIVLAQGTASRQGAFNAELRNPGGAPRVKNGVLILEFVVTYPAEETAVGGEVSRRVNAAASLTTQTLQQIRAIRVIGLGNSREVRRR